LQPTGQDIAHAEPHVQLPEQTLELAPSWQTPALQVCPDAHVWQLPPPVPQNVVELPL
jgi:hypothetical protein